MLKVQGRAGGKSANTFPVWTSLSLEERKREEVLFVPVWLTASSQIHSVSAMTKTYEPETPPGLNTFFFLNTHLGTTWTAGTDSSPFKLKPKNWPQAFKKLDTYPQVSKQVTFEVWKDSSLVTQSQQLCSPPKFSLSNISELWPHGTICRNKNTVSTLD